MIINYGLLCLIMINHKSNNCALWLQVRNLENRQNKPMKAEEEVTDKLVRLMVSLAMWE